MRIKISESDWKRIGERMGWWKEAIAGPPLSESKVPKLVRLQREMKRVDKMISSAGDLSAMSGNEALNEKIFDAIRALNEVTDAMSVMGGDGEPNPMNKAAGWRDGVRGALERGKDTLMGRRKRFRASDVSGGMPELRIYEGTNLSELVPPSSYDVEITMRKFVKDSPGESDYSMRVVRAFPGKPGAGELEQFLRVEHGAETGEAIDGMDSQLQGWIRGHERAVHKWLGELMESGQLDTWGNAGGER